MTPDHVFTALASPARRELLRLLRDEGAQPAGRLAERFDMSRPSVSEHLRVLRDAGLVSETRKGRERHYRLEAAPLMEIRDWLGPYERFWRERLATLTAVLDEMEDDDAR
ncbi:transcriptional regulator [Nonomuraea deserti]|uniref:Transcriptional regulator n=1 Tax=Nonomuraea deserti TaxID=1848322 RepID=A0A4R4UKC1_9ACTN|nr:metalloregulator ArsR/SmtB family transcription factor [Nonomuraea deserti]TDC89504.1 transcriptional regulator [Nonomuraea deserti]